MIRKTLTILSLIGLLLSAGAWLLSGSGGWSHTHFYTGQSGEELGVTFICADGRIGWDEASDMSDSVLSPDHGVSLWLPTVVLAGSFLFSIFQKFCERVVSSTMRRASRKVRGVGMVLGRAAAKLRKPLTIFSLIGLLLSVGLWGVSYWGLRFGSLTPRVEMGLGGIRWIERDLSMFLTASGDPAYVRKGFRGFETRWLPSYSRVVLFPSGPSPVKRWSKVNVYVPLWIPTLLFAALFLSCRPFHYRRRKRKKLGLCLKCGYDLRASKDRCPECGNEFETKCSARP